jgi:hypothetical protein
VKKRRKYKIGERVRIAQYEKIKQTLDTSNCLEGLLFMDGMREICGQEFEISQNVKWVYDECSRKMLKCKGIIALKNVTCDGKEMLGDRDCDRCCTYFWKQDWLEKITTGRPRADVSITASKIVARVEGHESVSGKNLDQQGSQREGGQRTPCCQYTRMTSMGTEFNRIEKAQHFIMRIGPALKRRMRRYAEKLRGKEGESKNTGSEAGHKRKISTKEGDLVRILPYNQIKETLDARGCCKGLQFLENAKKFCGGTYRVLNVPEYLLDQGGKKINKCRNLIILEGPTCDGKGTVLEEGCDRSCLHYWKEDWLEKIN